MKNKIINDIHAKSAFRDFEVAHGINIPRQSNRNLTCLKEYFSNKPLNLEERQVIADIVKNLYWCHASPDLSKIVESGGLSPLKLREHRGQDTSNSHTARREGIYGNLFFTLGMGENPSPNFLGQFVDYILIHPNKLLSKKPNCAARHAWTSPHLHEFYNETAYRALIGEVEYSFWHEKSTMTKHYCYNYKDGRKKEFSRTFSEEIFYGKDVLLGIALQFVQHMRHLNLNSAEFSLAEVSALLTALMPGYMSLELKVPGNIFIPTTIEEQQLLGIEINKQQAHRALEAICDFNELIRTRKAKKQYSDNSSYERSDLKVAIMENNVEEVDRLVSLSQQDKQCKIIYHFLQLNKGFAECYQDPVSDAVKNGSIPILETLFNHGANLNRAIEYWLSLAATKAQYEVVYWLCKNVRLAADELDFNVYQSPLLIAAKQGREDDAIKLIALGFNVNTTWHGARESHQLGYSVLHYAAQNNLLGLIEKLLGSEPNLHVDKLAANGETPLSIALAEQNNKLAEALKAAGADDTLCLKGRSKIKHCYRNGVAIITGSFAGKSVVVMGHYADMADEHSPWVFPGGGRDQVDNDYIDCAAREAREETGLNIREMLNSREATAKKIALFKEQVDGIQKEIGFIHFELGRLSKKVKNLRAMDDLSSVQLIYIDDIDFVQGHYKGRVIRRDNLLCLQHIMQVKSFSIENSLKKIYDACRYQEFGRALLVDAIKNSNLEKLTACVENGIKLDKEAVSNPEASGYVSPFGLACMQSELVFIKELSEKMNCDIHYGVHPLVLALKYHPDKNTLVNFLLNSNLVNDFGKLQALYQAVELGEKDLIPTLLKSIDESKTINFSTPLNGEGYVINTIIEKAERYQLPWEEYFDTYPALYKSVYLNNKWGFTAEGVILKPPLQVAAENNLAIVKYLLTNQPNIANVTIDLSNCEFLEIFRHKEMLRKVAIGLTNARSKKELLLNSFNFSFLSYRPSMPYFGRQNVILAAVRFGQRDTVEYLLKYIKENQSDMLAETCEMLKQWQEKGDRLEVGMNKALADIILCQGISKQTNRVCPNKIHL